MSTTHCSSAPPVTESTGVISGAETQLFRDDMTALRVLPPQDYIGATEAIDEVVEMVEKLALRRGLRGGRPGASRRLLPPRPTSSSATSPITTARPCCGCSPNAGRPAAPGQGRPAGRPVVASGASRRAELASPFGPGRPGWHVECAAIALSRIGFGFDVQGGGSDLIFPHHEFSAAHAECSTGQRAGSPGTLRACRDDRVDGHKMSKSRGNLVLVRRCAPRASIPPR